MNPNSADSTKRGQPKAPSLSGSGSQCILQKMEYQASDDRLSDLPVSIIHDILERIPILDAIRTSVLSRQWMYTWTTLSRLLFNTNGVGRDGLETVNYRSMKEFGKSVNNFITNVLIRHKGPIHMFKMSYPYYFIIDSVEEWILCLSRNDIRELIIKTDWKWYDAANLLKSSIYSCAKLTKLVLHNFTMDPPPSTFKGFLFLTSLALCKVELSPCGVETLVGNCPLLERLEIESSSSELRIRSPNLRSLELCGNFRKLCSYAPLLVDMDVGLAVRQLARENQSSFCNYNNFFGRFPNLVKLRGYGYFTRYLSIGIESYHPTLVFHHLKALYLYEVEFGDTKEIALVAHLIINAPNLHKLRILAKSDSKVGAPDVSFKDFGYAPNFTLMKLTYVNLSFVCDYPSGTELVKFLLETSPVLETMELQLADSPFDHVSAEILGFRRASPNAKITVKKSLTDG